MSRPEDEIKEKLAELEASLDEASQLPAARQKKSEISVPGKDAAGDSTASDLCLCGGFGLLLLGLFLFMNHVHVGSGIMSLLGFHSVGFGLTIVPLMIGVGLLIFDYKNRLGWIVTIASFALILFAVLSQIVMSFPSISLLGLVIMFLPFAAGGALIAKGMKMRQGKRD